MKVDVRRLIRGCIPCQRAKVNGHTKTPIYQFQLPDARFHHLHVDIVGPLPPSHDNRYLVTMIDLYTRCLEVIPIPDITADAVAHVIVSNWIARYRFHARITTDHGDSFRATF